MLDPSIRRVCAAHRDLFHTHPQPPLQSQSQSQSQSHSPLQIPHHGFAADVWSFGVLAYICLSGCHPLDLSGEDEDHVVAHRTRIGDVIPMEGVQWECVSLQARMFMCVVRVAQLILRKCNNMCISRCLRVNPAERPGFQECLDDPWCDD